MRIASFDEEAIAATKRLVNAARDLMRWKPCC